MIKINQAVIVEGRYDRKKVENIIDTLIIETDGFGIFKNKEKQALIRRLADTRGIVVLTDSDTAGFKIRSFLGGLVEPEKIIHAYVPDILGKEKRKDKPSKEKKIGVEGMTSEIILEALDRAGVTCTLGEKEERQPVTKNDLYEDGITGTKNSSVKKARLLKKLNLPERLSTNSLLKLINTFMTYDEYKAVIGEIDNENKEEIL
jgi:ribonuclease M5